MNNEDAKKILALYRSETTDLTDPDFVEALELAKSDPELGRWFKDHCTSYLSIQAKFAKIPVPSDLKDRILAGYKPAPARIIQFRPMVLLQAAAAIALCVGLTVLFWRSHGREDDFDTYRSRMVRTALNPYGMGLYSHDLQSIQAFFAKRQAPADYILPEGILKAQAVGCAIVRWQGQPVSMLCFHTGQSPAAGGKPDLWLFVIDQSSVHDAPAARSPIVSPSVQLMTAVWTQDGKTYVLAVAGDEVFLRKYL